MSETPDQASTRRRWITLAELVAVAGMLIAALTLYLNWSENREEAAARAATEQRSRAAGARLAIRVELADGGREARLSDPRHELIDVTVAFPRSLNVAAQSPAVPKIERDWFADGLLKVTDNGPDTREGRLPVLVTARYQDGEVERTGRAVIELAWRTNGRLIGGRSLSLEAARVRQTGGDQARVDALWKAETARFQP